MKKTLEFVVIAIGTLTFAFTCGAICFLLLSGKVNARRDIISYWTAGQLAVHHQNPYDVRSTLEIEAAKGRSETEGAMVMRNPPTSLLLVMPLGFLSLGLGSFLWAAVEAFCIIISVRIIWALHGKPKGNLNLFGYSFGPAVACLLSGQTAPFILLGLVLFLHFHQSRPFWAGVSLWLCALKPHLFLPFAVALLVWIVARKKYSILVGLASSLVVSAAIASAFDTNVWTNYHGMMATTGLETEFIPCLGALLRNLINHRWIWLQYLPCVAGSIWAFYYVRDRVNVWNWTHHGNLLILVSLLCAPYVWFTDTTVALPAILAGVYVCRSRVLLGALVLASAAIEAQALHGFAFRSPAYLWPAAVWLAWYLLAMKRAGKLNLTTADPGSCATNFPALASR